MTKRIIAFLLFIVAVNTSLKSQDKIIDKVIAVVGKDMVLHSEIETQYIQYMYQKGTYYDDPEIRCRAFEELLIQKLLLTQAYADSITVSDKQITQQIERKLNYYIMQFNSKEKFEEFYGKSVEAFKEEFYDITRDQIMIEQVQQGLVNNVKITPSEVRKFFNAIPIDSLPTIPSEYVIGQLVRKPPISEEERQKIINELKTLKKRVEEGEDFGLLAGIYSEDPGSAKKDGEISFGRGVMDPVFEATAFDLKKPGEISDVIETQFGFHIIMLVKRSGEFITVKHILKIPKPKPKDIAQAAKDLKNIKALIEMDSLTFEEAVAIYSQDPSKKNAGKLVNPYDGSSSFTLEAMDEAVAFTVRKLKEGEVSDPAIMVTGEGIQAYRLLYLYKKREKHVINLKEDYDKIQSFALQDKQNRVMNEWIENKIKQTYVNFIDESYKNCDLSYKWIY